jgi:hypothetical protein
VGKAVENVLYKTREVLILLTFLNCSKIHFERSRGVDLGIKLRKIRVFKKEFSNPQDFVEKSKIVKMVKFSIFCPKMRHLAVFRKNGQLFSTFHPLIFHKKSTGEILALTLEK